MGLLDKISYSLDKIGHIKKLIAKWNIEDCKSEKDFENSLYKSLHKELSDVQITKQYAVGRVKADILVGEDIIIELKLNLSKRDQFQRLIGQLEEYKKWKGRVILLLIGETEPNFRKQLKKMSKESEDDEIFMWGEASLIIVDKLI
jgi:hypothetical protein